MNKKLAIAVVLNFVLLILEITGLILCLQKVGISTFTFYTTFSNCIALVTSFLFCIFGIIVLSQKKPFPQWLKILRFISTACLTSTLILSICVIIPLYPNLFNYMLFKNAGFFQHLLCPIITIVSFLFFEQHSPLSKSAIRLSLLPTIAYGSVNIILNFLKIIAGPYPFLYLFVVPWYVPTICISFILLLSLIIANFLYKTYNKKASFLLKK